MGNPTLTQSTNGGIAISGDVEVVQPTHDDLNANANMQIADTDVSATNRVPVRAETITVAVAPAVTAGAYAAGDCVGAEMEFANFVQTAGDGGILKNALIVDDAGEEGSMELWLFDRTFTDPGDNAPWVATEDDLHNLICILSSATDGAWYDAGGTKSVCDIEASRAFILNGTSIFGQLVTREIITLVAVDDIRVILGALRNN